MSVKIDFITQDPNQNEFVLYLVEEGPWSDSIDDRMKEIQERIYGAVDAILDGVVANKYPESRGKKIRIQVDGHDNPPSKVSNLAEHLNLFVQNSDEYQNDLKEKGFAENIRIVFNEVKKR
jgi:hypothetical protein